MGPVTTANVMYSQKETHYKTLSSLKKGRMKR